MKKTVKKIEMEYKKNEMKKKVNLKWNIKEMGTEKKERKLKWNRKDIKLKNRKES